MVAQNKLGKYGLNSCGLFQDKEFPAEELLKLEIVKNRAFKCAGSESFLP